MSADGEVLARASGVRVRLSQSPASNEMCPEWPAPETASEKSVVRGQSSKDPIETRLVYGSLREIGPGGFWSRTHADIVEGWETTPVARVAMAADIASGPSSIADGRLWSFANLDTSIYLTRPPIDDWIFVEAETVSAGNGTAIVQARLGDRQARIGFANQVLFVAKR
jgi:hypothetical protein